MPRPARAARQLSPAISASRVLGGHAMMIPMTPPGLPRSLPSSRKRGTVQFETLPDLANWLHPDLSVRDSHIQGRGLFCTSDLTAGAAIARFGGFLYPVSARNDPTIVQPSTAAGVADFVLLAEHINGKKDQSDYINHSCSPNTGMADAITVVAIRDIHAGEELTADYAYWEADQDYVMKNACHCQSGNCRGRITGEDWRLFEKYDHLAQWSSPFIRRRIASAIKEA
jgi:uncharacterized protein